MIAAALVTQAPDDLRPAVDALVADDRPPDTAARAEVCRFVLDELPQTPAFQPTVERAIAQAVRPHMPIDPVTGAFVIAILFATSKVNLTTGSIQPGAVIVDAIKALRLPELLHELPEVIKAMPVGILNALGMKGV